MPVIAKDKGGGDTNPIPAGAHQAICYGIVDIGTQQPFSENFKPARKVMLMFEFPEERIKLERDGVVRDLPRALSREFTLSLHKKAGLRAFLVSWRGRQFTEQELEGFDLKNVLGANCMANVVHNDKGYANVAAAMPLVKGLQRRNPENELVYFSLDDFQGDELPTSIPEWIRKKIEASDEWGAGEGSGHEPPPPDDDDIPF